MAKEVLSKDTSEVKKKYSYQIGEQSMAFSVRIDVKKYLKQNILMLKEALKDMEADLSKANGEE